LDSRSRYYEVTGSGLSPARPRTKSIERAKASIGKWVQFFDRGLGCSHFRGRRLPAFLASRQR